MTEEFGWNLRQALSRKKNALPIPMQDADFLRGMHERFRERISRPEIGILDPVVVDAFFDLPEMAEVDQQLEAWFRGREESE